MPAPVRIDTDGGVGEGVAHGGDPCDVVGKRLATLSNFDLDGINAAEPRKYFRHALRRDCGNGGVHGNAGPKSWRETSPARFQGSSEPARGFVVVVFRKGAEFAPTQRPFQEECFPLHDAAELHAHWQ